MAKGDIKIEFLKDYAGTKKGTVTVFSRDIANMLILKKVAKIFEPKKPKNQK